MDDPQLLRDPKSTDRASKGWGPRTGIGYDKVQKGPVPTDTRGKGVSVLRGPVKRKRMEKPRPARLFIYPSQTLRSKHFVPLESFEKVLQLKATDRVLEEKRRSPCSACTLLIPSSGLEGSCVS